MKLFFAYHLADSARETLSAIQKHLATALEAASGERSQRLVRFVSPEKLHMTLVFVGDVSRDEAEALIDLFESTVPPQTAVDLSITQVGAFPDTRRPRVVWAGVEESGQTTIELVERLRAGIADRIATKIETRAYRPHITIAYPRRGISRDAQRSVGAVIEVQRETCIVSLEERGLVESRAVAVDRVSLVESVPTPDGTRYDDLVSYRSGKITSRHKTR